MLLGTMCVCVCVCDCGHADTYPEFVKLVERMWAEDPDDRPPFDIILAEVTDIFDPDRNGNALAGTTSTTKSTNDDAQSTDEETESTPEGESEGEAAAAAPAAAAAAEAQPENETSSDEEQPMPTPLPHEDSLPGASPSEQQTE